MAADRDGRLQPEDKIIGIEKEDGEVIDLVEKKLNDVVRYIRGPRGTKVRLDRSARRHQGKAGLRDHPREDRAHGAACQEQGHREQGERRQGAQDRHHQPARVLRRHRGDPPRRSRRRQRDGRLPQDLERIQGQAASTRSSSISAATAAACSRKPRRSPACSSTPARSSRSRKSSASSISTTTTKGPPGTARSSS